MKILITASLMALSSMAFAQDCSKKVLKSYKEANTYSVRHELTGEVVSINKFVKSASFYGKEIKLNYSFDVDVYIASNRVHGNYSMDALVVNPTNCKILQMVSLYND